MIKNENGYLQERRFKEETNGSQEDFTRVSPQADSSVEDGLIGGGFAPGKLAPRVSPQADSSSRARLAKICKKLSPRVWEYFNIKVLTIETGDRKRIREELNKVGIKNSKINIFKGAKKRKNDGKKDLTLIDIFKHSHYDETSINLTSNHIKIIDNAYKKKLENILIFEDDFVFINFDIKKLERIVEWLKNNEWDVFYFGQCGWPIFISIPIKKDIVKVFKPLMAHSYVLSREGMRKVLEYYNGNEMLHFDKLLCNATKKKYASFPSMVHQNVSPALYSKALRKMNLPHIDHIKFFTFTDYFSIGIFVLIFGILILFLLKILVRKKK